MLTVEGLRLSYGEVQVLDNLSMSVGQGEIVLLIGRNGSGKSTALKAIFGLERPQSGHVVFRDEDITQGQVEHHVDRGMTLVPQGQGVFRHMTVQRNLELAVRCNGAKFRERVPDIYRLFPWLSERRKTPAGKLSGGQQQLLAIAMGLMTRPQLLLVDEPSVGLAPKVVAEVLDVLARIRTDMECSILLVEQNVRTALKVADRVYVLKQGRVSLEDRPDRLLDRVELLQVF